MDSTFATVAKIAIAAVILVAVIAVGKYVVDKMNPAVEKAVNTDEIKPLGG